MRTLLTFIIILLFFITPEVKAQFGLGNKIKNRAQQKLERKIEDRIVEELSEELARMAFKPIDRAMDDMLRSQYEEEQGGEVDWEKSGEAYSDFLKGMNAATNVPESYHFDIQVEAEMKDYEKEKHEMTFLYAKGQKILGLKQKQDGEDVMIVIDNERDAIIMYSTEDGKKKAQAIPSMNKFAMGLAKSSMENQDDRTKYVFKKTGKTKKIAGYLSDEFTFESEMEKGDAWIAQNFPISFFDIFGFGMNQFMPKTYSDTMVELDGMVMMSNYENKEDKKIQSSFKVKKVIEENTEITNKDWGLEPTGK
jgi:hypothetical protein